MGRREDQRLTEGVESLAESLLVGVRSFCLPQPFPRLDVMDVRPPEMPVAEHERKRVKERRARKTREV